MATGSGKWVVTDGFSSKIHITEPCTFLTGSVTIEGGTLDADQDVDRDDFDAFIDRFTGP